MASPSTPVYTGTVRSTGALLNVRTVGFRPRVVMLHVGGVEGHWQDGMADASAYKRTAAGAGSLVTVGGVTPLSDGFSLGTDADLNPAAPADIRYTAIA